MLRICFAIVLLAGCAPTEFAGLHTPSRIFDPRVAEQAGLTQAQVDRCVAIGQKAHDSDNEFSAGARNLVGGNAYEKCVRDTLADPSSVR
jgi:hypothetical protein